MSAFAIDRRIVRRDVAREINNALRAEMKAGLKSRPLPHWVTERIHDLTGRWYPFVGVAASNKNDSVEKDQMFVVNPLEEGVEDVSEQLQDFFASLEQDLRLDGDSSSSSKKAEKEVESEVDDTTDRGKREMESEANIRETMEAVERLITWLFYDRLDPFLF